MHIDASGQCEITPSTHHAAMSARETASHSDFGSGLRAPVKTEMDFESNLNLLAV